MTDRAKRRWGIFTMAVLMALATFILNIAAGKKIHLYVIFWVYIAYLAYKGDVKTMHQLIKWVLIINVAVMVGVALFADHQTLRFIGTDSLGELFLAFMIPIGVKAGLLFYLSEQKKQGQDTKLNVTPNPHYHVDQQSIPIGKVNKISPSKKLEDMESAYSEFYKPEPLVQQKNEVERVPNANTLESSQDKTSMNLTLEPSEKEQEHAYEKAAAEIDSGSGRRGLWTKLWSENDGDEKATKLRYIKIRVNEILDDLKEQKQRELEKLNTEKALAAKATAEELKAAQLKAAAQRMATERLQISKTLEDPEKLSSIREHYRAAIKFKEATDTKIELFRSIGGVFNWDQLAWGAKGPEVFFAGRAITFSTLNTFLDWFDNEILTEIGTALGEK